MSIRPAREGDFAEIAAITNHYVATTAINFAYEPIAEVVLRAKWQGHRDRFPWVVAEDRGAVVGYAKAGTWRERAAYGWTAEVGLYVADASRGQGHGRALYGALFDELVARGFRSAIAGITLPNVPSIALHRAFGFTSVGIVHDAGWKLGTWHAIELWQKRFATGAAGPSQPARHDPPR